MTFFPYPRHVHKHGGVFSVVHSDEERDQKVAEGWCLTPLEAEQGIAVVEPAAEPIVARTRRGRPPKAVETV